MHGHALIEPIHEVESAAYLGIKGASWSTFVQQGINPRGNNGADFRLRNIFIRACC